MAIWYLLTLGLIDVAAGGILFFNEATIVKFIGIILLGKGIISIWKSLFEW